MLPVCWCMPRLVVCRHLDLCHRSSVDCQSGHGLALPASLARATLWICFQWGHQFATRWHLVSGDLTMLRSQAVPTDRFSLSSPVPLCRRIAARNEFWKEHVLGQSPVDSADEVGFVNCWGGGGCFACFDYCS